jgi:hypothetical protein
MANPLDILQPIIQEVEQLDDQFPVILFPIRIETRFMTIKHVAKGLQRNGIMDQAAMGALDNDILGQLSHAEQGIQLNSTIPNPVLIPGVQVAKSDALHASLTDPLDYHPDQKELWIRLFPDDIAIHTHEENVTEDELESTQSFWEAIHQAETVPDSIPVNQQETYKQNYRIGAWEALLNSYGTARSIWLIRTIKPTNDATFPQQAPTFSTIDDLKPVSWNEQPHSRVMPKNFAALLFDDKGVLIKSALGNAIPNPLFVGINPQENQEDAYQESAKGLVMPDNIKWLTNFEEAEKVGMGIRIPLESDISHQFSKLIVIGLRSDINADNSQDILQELLDNHFYAEGGLSILPFGTPTNNTESASVGKSLDELDPAISYALFVEGKSLEEANEAYEKTDGKRMDEALGSKTPFFQQVLCGDAKEISSAIWMNKALSPATLGYALPQYFYPDISPEQVQQTISFMEQYVLGRGSLPSLRIDDQPYGFITASAYSKWTGNTNEFSSFLSDLNNNVLQKLVVEWQRLSSNFAPHLSKELNEASVSAVFLRILEQHAGSVDYFQRLILDHEILETLKSVTGNNTQDLVSNIGSTKTLLRDALSAMGFELDASLLGLDLLQANRLADLTGPVIDKFSFSEDRTLSDLQAGNFNYFQWLANPSTTFESILAEDIFNHTDNPPPRELLYLLSRQALLRQYLYTSLQIGLNNSPFVDAVSLDFPRNMLWVEEGETPQREPHFQNILLNIAEKAAAELSNTTADNLATKFIQDNGDLFLSNNRWVVMNQAVAEGSDEKVADFINNNLETDDQLANIKAQKAFFDKLGNLSTAALERLFSEHLDLCHYRLDAWLLGLANYRLEEMRSANTNGIYIGAYGYLENLIELPSTGIYVKEIDNPRTGTGDFSIAPVLNLSSLGAVNNLNDSISSSYIYLGGQASGQVYSAGDFQARIDIDLAAQEVLPVPQVQVSSLGFIPAPSISHATTAAVLRNAYASHRKTGSPDEAFAVDLSSARVREAVYFLEGMKNGQSLAELLGYKFERALRESPNYAIHLLFEIRKKYPFEMQPVGQNADELIKNEARNVVNGLDLVEGYRNAPNEDTFFNDLDSSSPITDAQKADIRRYIMQLENTLDAIKDLLLAETMYQLSVENTERANAAQRALNDLGNVQIPEVIDIPREGIALTHRVGVHLSRNGGIKEWLGDASMRSTLEPKVNRWLREKLPDPDKVCFRVRWVLSTDDKGNPTYIHQKVSLHHLALQPIDFVYLMHQDRENLLDGELRYRIDNWVRTQQNLNSEQYIEILARDRTDFANDEIHLFALTPLALNLADLIINARAMSPEDLILENDPSSDQLEASWESTLFKRRVDSGIEPFKSQIDDLTEQVVEINRLSKLDESELQAEDQLALERFLKKLRETMLEFTSYGWKDALPTRDRRITPGNMELLYLQAKKVLEKANKKWDKVTAYLQDHSNTPQDEEETRIEILKGVVEEILSKTFNIFPEFSIANETAYKTAFDHDDLLDFAGDFAVEEWIQSLIPVRPKMDVYNKINTLAEFFDAPEAGRIPKPIQFPFINQSDRWLAVEYPDYYNDYDENDQLRMPDENLSLAFEYPADFTVNRPCSGFIFDEWTEQIPVKETNIGVAMHYDQPNSEPPNAVLCAVPASLSGNWIWDELIGAIDESFNLAKLRTVDPDILKASPLSQFLPAVIPPINKYSHVPAVDLGRNMANAQPGSTGPIYKNYDLDQEQLTANFDLDDLDISDLIEED